MFLLKWKRHVQPTWSRIHTTAFPTCFNCISYLFLHSVYQERKLLTGVSTCRCHFSHSAVHLTPRHSPSGHAVFASPVLCRTVAVLLQASCRYPTFTQLNPWINRHERKHGASYGFKNKQKKSVRSIKCTGQEKTISYSKHRRVRVATYSLECWKLKLPQYIPIMRSGFLVPAVNRYHNSQIVNTFT